MGERLIRFLFQLLAGELIREGELIKRIQEREEK